MQQKTFCLLIDVINNGSQPISQLELQWVSTDSK